jgi:hypothetical protein
MRPERRAAGGDRGHEREWETRRVNRIFAAVEDDDAKTRAKHATPAWRPLISAVSAINTASAYQQIFVA